MLNLFRQVQLFLGYISPLMIINPVAQSTSFTFPHLFCLLLHSILSLYLKNPHFFLNSLPTLRFSRKQQY